jgi:hypothetical protein
MSTITINGIGVAATVEVNDGESYTDALNRAGFAAPAELDVNVNGETIENPDEVAVETDAVVTATPKQAALGRS